MSTITPSALKCAAVLLTAFAFTACTSPPPQATGYQKTELLILASAAAIVTLSSGSSGSKSVASPGPTPTNIDRAPAYAPGSTHESYRLGDTDSFYMADCTGAQCYRDSDGELADVRESTELVYPNGFTFRRSRIQGPSTRTGDPTLSVRLPPRDVRQAWRDGWTGDGVNILIVDAFEAPRALCCANNGISGYTAFMSARQIAPDATYYTTESGVGLPEYRQRLTYTGIVYDATRTRIDSASTKFHVVNHNPGLISSEMSPTRGAPTQEELDRAARHPAFRDLLSSNQIHDTADAVITKAAGNEGVDAGYFADNVALAMHQDTAPRTLIVGGLENAGNARIARIADNSNHAGDNVEIQSRFLVEDHFGPYRGTTYLCDAAVPAATDCRNRQRLEGVYFAARGTSIAAPRVAGFAALVRDKFPNLSGAHTANILLETATTMGLACHTGAARKSPSCARNIYGQGRVDIGAALAPIGTLR